MRKSALFVFFIVSSLLLGAQAPASLISDYQHLIRSDEARIRTELRVTDTMFYSMIDTLSGYCTDRKFSLPLQIQNLQGLHRFLKTVTNREQIRTGQV